MTSNDMNTSQNQNIQIRIDSELKNKLKQVAKLKGISMSSYIKLTVSNQIEKDHTMANLNLAFTKSTLNNRALSNLGNFPRKNKMSTNEAINYIHKMRNK